MNLGAFSISRLTGLTQFVLVLLILVVMAFRREGLIARREPDEVLRPAPRAGAPPAARTRGADDGAVRLAGRKALVTGAGRGFGRAIALGLAREGADVAVHFNSSAEGASAVVEEIARARPRGVRRPRRPRLPGTRSALWPRRSSIASAGSTCS